MGAGTPVPQNPPGRGAERPLVGAGTPVPQNPRERGKTPMGESHPCRPCTSAAAPGCGSMPSSLQVVLQKCNQHARRRNDGVVERVRQIGLLVSLFLTRMPRRACLRVAQVGAAAHLKVFLLARSTMPRRRRLLTFRSARSPEQHSSVRTGISSERKKSTVFCHSLLNHVHALLRLADDDHLLLLKLVDAVNAALLDAVRADLLAEARANSWSASAEAGPRRESCR